LKIVKCPKLKLQNGSLGHGQGDSEERQRKVSTVRGGELRAKSSSNSSSGEEERGEIEGSCVLPSKTISACIGSGVGGRKALGTRDRRRKRRAHTIRDIRKSLNRKYDT